jgi:predicted RNA-binding Zn ribbon-like protein
MGMLRNLSMMILRVTNEAAEKPRFLFLGNDPALDFLNTAPLVDGAPSEQLTDYGALVDFVTAAELVLPEDAAFARRTWSPSERADASVERARSLRELLRKVVTSIAGDTPVSAQHLAKLNAMLRDSGGVYTELRAMENGFERRLRLRRDEPDDILAPIVQAIAAFLATADLTHVRKCEDATCALFFVDTSKNHRRRWCSMELCGNRNKVGAFRARRGS